MEVLFDKTDTGYTIKSPAVGIYSQIPQEGQLVNSTQNCGSLTRLGKKHLLLLPKKIEGRVKRTNSCEANNVGYEDILFYLETATLDSSHDESLAQENETQNGKVVTSLIDGIFYSRPAPDEPSYVEVGSKVTKGQVLGLVEVMKTFNQILYSGNHLPETATIKEINVKDGSEVKSGQVLFVLE